MAATSSLLGLLNEVSIDDYVLPIVFNVNICIDLKVDCCVLLRVVHFS